MSESGRDDASSAPPSMTASQSVKSSSVGAVDAPLAAKPKVSKKDRHMKLVYEFSRFLDRTNEETEQEVLLLKRTLRETLESLDEELKRFIDRITENNYLLDKSEKQLIHKLHELKEKLKHREKLITQLETDLDGTALKRSTVVGTELKSLVDKLIAIGFNLPDDIERFVENEAFEVNKEIISTRIEHSKVVSEQRMQHVHLEHSFINQWEAVRAKWRQLRHDKAMNIYNSQIHSDDYNDPSDRRQYFSEYRQGQAQRREKFLSPILQRILSLTFENITSETITDIQQQFQQVNERELEFIQQCYNSLTELRSNTSYLARERVEELRKELHVYGALKVDPKLAPLAKKLDDALNHPELAELWRLGGGLKPDVLMLVSECTSEDIVYERVVDSMRDKLEFIICGFGVKAAMEEKGRLSMLDKIRSLVGKLRSAPRAEIASVVRSLLVEVEDMNRFEAVLPAQFNETVARLAEEMKEELLALDKRLASVATATQSLAQSSALGGTRSGSKLPLTANQTQLPGSSNNNNTLAKSAAARTRTLAATGQSSTNLQGTQVAAPAAFIDPLLLKQWNRQLAILFYASDLPADLQELLQFLLVQVSEQRECNKLVDEVVLAVSGSLLARMDRVYKKLIDRIASYLEVNANFVFTQTTNLCDFYLKIAKLMELHRQLQQKLDHASQEEFWDLKEDSKIALDDLEEEYKRFCTKIRQATKQEDIDGHFAEVLEVLEKISAEYREYHHKACFAADKYPLSLMNEFRESLMNLCKRMFYFPQESHPIVRHFDELFDNAQRLNRPYFEADPLAAGFARVSFTEKRQEFDEFLRDRGLEGKTVVEGEAVFSSPNLSSASLSPRQSQFAGSYSIDVTLTQLIHLFEQENAFKDKQELVQNEEQSSEQKIDAMESTVAPIKSTKPATDEESLTVIDKPVFEAHDLCPFMRKESAVLPLSSLSEYEAMHPDDRDDFETALNAGFVPLPEGPASAPMPVEPVAAPAAGKDAKGKAAKGAPAAAPIEVDNSGTQQALSDEDRQKYALTLQIVRERRRLLRRYEDSNFLRQNVPVDLKDGSALVLGTEITGSELSLLFSSIRDSVLGSLEREGGEKLTNVERDMSQKKDGLTDELEERIRNHWPRRGRVETEIKQPREAELLGHKDKTYRLIMLVQKKLIDLQSSFEATMQSSQQKCDKFVQEITGMKGLLAGDFKNLAALQAIDVRARGTFLDFQADCTKMIEILTKHSDVDIQAVAIFAKDFRKICPVQSPENESGYSEQELSEIQVIVDGQCGEMDLLSAQWKERIAQLLEQQTQSQQNYSDFIDKYNKSVQAVSMAEGLGQKYGAPRRRAQERIRTEIARDEKRAGRVDELLAEIEFFASECDLLEEKLREDDSQTVASSRPDNEQESAENRDESVGPSPSKSTKKSVRLVLPASSAVKSLSSSRLVESTVALNKLCYVWHILRALRERLSNRVSFLVVDGPQTGPTVSPVDVFPWLDEARFTESFALSPSPFIVNKSSTEDEALLPGESASMATVFAFFEDVDKICRKETQDLYNSEGLSHMLSKDTGGVPASLQDWLTESKEKVLGKDGYRERAWKRLWAQSARYDSILVRFRNLSDKGKDDYLSATVTESQTPAVDDHSSKHGMMTTTSIAPPVPVGADKLSIQGASLRCFAFANMLLAKRDGAEQRRAFGKLLAVWANARELNERKLRPRLGSPDKVEELLQLDKDETARSQDMTLAVKQFRSSLVRGQIDKFRCFAEDVAKMSKGLLLLIDNSLRQELLQIPPDTEIPKKHLTLKKLRKAQRMREEVARGGQDNSQKRVWAGLELPIASQQVIKASEDLVIDLGKDPKDFTGSVPDTVSAAAAAPDPKDKKAAAAAKDKKPADKKGAAEPAAVEAKPSLLPDIWQQKLKEMSVAECLVSSAHRIVLEERNIAVEMYIHYLRDFLADVREDYTTVLSQEQSWNERWTRQVNMLKN